MAQKKSNKAPSRGCGRTRNYACVVYPESAPDGWQSIISEAKISCFVSPLHDSDVNPTGEKKKSHHHVVAMFDSVKTQEQAQEFFKTFGGVGCEAVKDLRAYSRYLCHLDNPEKAQYSPEDVKAFGGADYRFQIGCVSDKKKAIKEMIEFIEANDVICFSDLSLYAMQNEPEWFDALINTSTVFIKSYIKSRTWKVHKYKPETDA